MERDDQNPYEPPQSPLQRVRRPLTRLHTWLLDRIALVGCGCVCFVVAWSVVMLIVVVFLGLPR